MRMRTNLLIVLGCMMPLGAANANTDDAPNNTLSRDIDVGYFNKVHVSGGGKLVIARSLDPSMNINGLASCIDSVTVDIREGSLTVESNSKSKFDCDLTFNIGAPELREISQSGGGEVFIEHGFYPVDELTFNLQGGGTANLQNVRVKTLDIQVSDGGTLFAHVEELLNVEITNGGSVSYAGTPNIHKTISGGGSIQKIQSETAIVYGEFTDERDNRTYKTVKIGNQEWLAENYAYLPYVCEFERPECGVWVYGHQNTDLADARETEEFKKYGALYSWHAAKELTPTGWRLPSDEDWLELEAYIGIDASDLTTKEWRGDNHATERLKVTGSTGFNTVFGGWMTDYGKFNFIGAHANFWCSDEIDESRACERMIGVTNEKIGRAGGRKGAGFSVRYVRDSLAVSETVKTQ